MPSEDIQLTRLVINELNQATYDSITKDPGELYVITDAVPEVNTDGISTRNNANREVESIGNIDANGSGESIHTWTGDKITYDEIGTYYGYTSPNGDLVYVRKFNPSIGDTVYTGIDTVSSLSILDVVGEFLDLSDGVRYERNSNFDTVDDTAYSNTTLYNILGDSDNSNVYLKSETYSKAEVNNLLNNNIDTTHITNCIKHIEKTVFIEFEGNELVLKAGTKVVIPNGTSGGEKVFVERVLEEDLTKILPNDIVDGDYFVYVNSECTEVHYRIYGSVDSGVTDPLTFATTFYDSSDNYVVAHNTGGAIYCSFPVAMIKVLGGNVVGTPQRFNNIGFIGKTIWYGKDITVLIPCGFDSYGSYANIEYTTENIYVSDLVLDSTKSFEYVGGITGNNNFAAFPSCNVLRSNNVGDVTNFTENAYIYIPNENWACWYDYANDHVGYAGFCMCLGIGVEAGTNRICSLQHARNYRLLTENEKGRIGSWSYPSNIYVDLTLGEDGATYTAPANGYIIIQKRVGTNNSEYVVVNNLTNGMKQERNNNISGNNLSIYMPFKKGDVCRVGYNASGTLELFRFYYAQGEVED